MKRTALLSIVLSVPFGASAAYGSGAHHTKVVSDCIHAHYKPGSITLACGDGNFALTKIKYSKWGKRVANGTDRTFENSCDPDCAEGKPVYHHDHFKLDHPKKKHGVKVFTRARVYRDGKLYITYPLG